MNHQLIRSQDNVQPQTKLQLVQSYGKAIQNGDRTIVDVGRELGLNKNQIKFVELYMSKDYVGSSGREAAGQAYGYDLTKPAGKRSADNVANKNLKHEGILTLIAVLHDCEGFNDEWMDRRLKFIADQNNDLKAAMMAINEYNKLQQRLKTITEIQVKPAFDFSTFTPDELKQFIELTTRAKIRYSETQHLPLLNEQNEQIG